MSSQGLMCCGGNAYDVEGSTSTATQIESHNRGGIFRPRSYCQWILSAIAITLLLFPVVTIPILFTLYSKLSKTKIHQSAAVGTFATSVSSGISPLMFGTPVSMSATGSVQVGGGTTIYRGIGTIPFAVCPFYLSATPLFDDKFLVSYADTHTGVGYASVMQVDSSKKAIVLSTAENLHDLYHIVTLNQGTGLFITISQDSYKNPVLIAGRPSLSNNYAITFGMPVIYSANASYDPSITALSNSTFVIAYYGVNGVLARYGHTNSATLGVTISTKELLVAPDSNYATYFTITALSESQAMFLYYDGGGSDQLNAVVLNTTVASNGGLSLNLAGMPTAYVGSKLGINLLRATTLDSGDVVVAYGDATNNNGITCTLVNYDNSTGVILFTSNLQITTGSTVSTDPNNFPYVTSLSIATIGGGSQVVVMFVDLGLDGAIVAAVVDTVSSLLIRASPNYIMNKGTAAMNTKFSFLSLAVSKRSHYASQVAILSSVTDTSCATPSVTDFSLMEILPKPIGVMATTVTSTDSYQYGSVVLSGMAGGLSGLIPGVTYYSTTSGKIVTDGAYYGRNGATSSDASASSFFYVSDNTNQVIVSTDSEIGIAISSDTILLSR